MRDHSLIVVIVNAGSKPKSDLRKKRSKIQGFATKTELVVGQKRLSSPICPIYGWALGQRRAIDSNSAGVLDEDGWPALYLGKIQGATKQRLLI